MTARKVPIRPEPTTAMPIVFPCIIPELPKSGAQRRNNAVAGEGHVAQPRADGIVYGIADGA
jgi:hypothetical protein